ncbi:MAG: hypothetical protein JJ926_18055 [Roseitalea sp.]|nr:hypothetical protein [Roseitalea sp.]MBO6953785.1 hypothetical protein [Rhizobiaceae bacterium]MBO6594133.1 hypothetical protein [Roseitalea sp.]MBO6601434.1 hypothetical protein [Roseitalea sp.]MBO6613524.1 hypothetical protein [Roseitalea sp.]
MKPAVSIRGVIASLFVGGSLALPLSIAPLDEASAASRGDYCSMFVHCDDGLSCTDWVVGECRPDPPGDSTIGELQSGERFSGGMAGDRTHVHIHQVLQQRCPAGEAISTIRAVRHDGLVAGMRLGCRAVGSSLGWVGEETFTTFVGGPIAYAKALAAGDSTADLSCQTDRFVRNVNVWGVYGVGFPTTSRTQTIQVHCGTLAGEEDEDPAIVYPRTRAGEFYAGGDGTDKGQTTCPENMIATGVSMRTDDGDTEDIRTFQQFMLLCRDPDAVAAYHAPKTQAPVSNWQTAVAPPDLSVDWTSTIGDLNWAEGWYGTTNNIFTHSQPQWDAQKNAYVSSGRWGRQNGEEDQGGFEFVFTSACYVSIEWWRGTHRNTNTLGQGQGRCKEITDPEGRPNYDSVWNSTFGTINFLEGHYGSPQSPLNLGQPVWNEQKGVYIATGTWGRHDGDANAGGVEFVFTDECNFTGKVWYHATPDATQTWGGSCGEAFADPQVSQRQQQELEEAAALQRQQQQQEAQRLQASQAAAQPQRPNFSVIWTSDYGDISWEGGWYGETNNLLSIGAPEWDNLRKAYVSPGYWGRRDGVQNAGGLEFVFSGPCNFTGYWWYSNNPNQKTAWSGQCK